MEPIRISYRIGLNDETTEVFDFDLDGETFESVGTAAQFTGTYGTESARVAKVSR